MIPRLWEQYSATSRAVNLTRVSFGIMQIPQCFFVFFPFFCVLMCTFLPIRLGVFFPRTVPLTVARFSLIELYSHSNLLKSVLAVTSTIEVVGSEAFKKKKKDAL